MELFTICVVVVIVVFVDSILSGYIANSPKMSLFTFREKKMKQKVSILSSGEKK